MLKNVKSTEKLATAEPKCICYRKIGTVHCSICDYFCSGRIMKTCPKHENCVFLYDRSSCISCKAALKFLKEIPVDYNIFKQNENTK